MNEQTSEMGVGGKLLVLSGSVLIIAGVVVLLFIAQLIYQLFYEPDQIYLIKYLMDTIDLSDKAFFGRIDNAPFYIHVSDPIKYFLYLMGIGLILTIVVGILKGILGAGTTLIKVAYSSVNNSQE
ncbi:MAG: hypothetical protein KAT25_04770 [Sulfuriflexus sp.]|nr:hypothetical protein [Sulfuriflexus sp.]